MGIKARGVCIKVGGVGIKVRGVGIKVGGVGISCCSLGIKAMDVGIKGKRVEICRCAPVSEPAAYASTTESLAAGGAGEEAEAADGWFDEDVAQAMGGEEGMELVRAEAAAAFAVDAPQRHRQQKPRRSAR